MKQPHFGIQAARALLSRSGEQPCVSRRVPVGRWSQWVAAWAAVRRGTVDHAGPRAAVRAGSRARWSGG